MEPHPLSLKKYTFNTQYNRFMFKNYFKTALKNLTGNRTYTIINIAGLSVGIAVCMLIFIIIQFQTSFDNFHSKRDRIYRVLTEYSHAEAAKTGKDIPFPLPASLKTTFGQIEQVAPFWASHNDKLTIPGNNGAVTRSFKEDKGVYFTDISFFKMFDFPLLEGSYESLRDPNNVLITKEVAEKYFGDWKTAMGRTIKLEAGGSLFSHATDILKVSGILATIPENTDFQFKLVVSFGTGITEDMAKNTDWKDRTNSDYGCFIMLPQNISADNFNQQLKTFSERMESADYKDSFLIQPLNEVHYDTQTGNYACKTISTQLLNVLWMIAAFILLIACVNFINLSTAQAFNRSKEVSIRKVLGSSRAQLQLKFIIETFLIVIIAVIFAGVIAIVAMPYLSQILELSLSLRKLSSTSIVIFLSAVTIVVTLLASFYPSIVLSGFSPVDALKNNLKGGPANGILLRRGLVVFQFIIAQALIIGTMIIVKQMNYFMDQPLGFDKETVINIPFRVDTSFFKREDYLKHQLLAVNGVKAVTFSSNTPVENDNDIWSTFKFDNALKEAEFKAITKFADNGYVPAYKLQLIAGRNLKPSGMTREFLVNETFMKRLGINNPDEILNKEISMWGDRIQCPVVGVLKDFNNESFRQGIAPMLITTNGTMYSQAGIKLESKNISSTLQSVKKIWEQTLPNFVYEYKFLDEKIADFYKQESQLAQLYKIFAAIALFLSCLGLYGLALFMAVQRTKEVGIRKVFGASAGSIVYMFSREFLVLIIIAFAIASPAAWYFMHNWLQNYVYSITISWKIFAAGGLAALVIALATIGFRAIKAAFANPVDSLRSQ